MNSIRFDTSFWQGLHYNNIFVLAVELLLAGGWFFIFYSLFGSVKHAWLHWRQELFVEENPNVLLEISIPKNNERTIEAIEQFFAQVHGLRKNFTWWEVWWKGMFNLKVSFEIVSFEGYVKFFIRSTYKHKHLIEAALYTHYPDVDIRELKPTEDFVHLFPDKVPHSEFDMLGAEYVLSKPNYYPMKTYKEYESETSGEFVDPIRHLLELMSHLKEGEYLWYQITVVPESEKWALSHKKHVDRLQGKDVPPEREVKSIPQMVRDHAFSILLYILCLPLSLLKEVYRQLFKGTGKILASQVKHHTYTEIPRQLKGLVTEVPRQMKGVGREVPRQFKGTFNEFARQVYCLHEAFLSQFRKKKPAKPGVASSGPIVIPPPLVATHHDIHIDSPVNITVPPLQFPSDYLFMTKKGKKVIDAIERKLSNQIFKTCIRGLYFAKKPVFAKFRFWAELHGFFRHMSDVDYNVLRRGDHSTTNADYFFTKLRKRMRQNIMIRNAKSRDWYAGDDWIYLSAEELTTLWHIPRTQDLYANILTADRKVPPPKEFRVNHGYKKERLLDVPVGDAPEDLPVTEFEPYTYP